MKKRLSGIPRNIVPKDRTKNLRALLASRMVSDLIEMVKTRKAIHYIPKYPERICCCDKKKYGISCCCTPGKAPCSCGVSVAVEEEIPETTIRAFKEEIKQCRLAVKQMDLETVRKLNNEKTDSELITIWNYLRESSK